MPLRPPAGYIRPGYNPLQVANAPTVGTASAGDTTASVAFTAPSNVGGGAISLYYAVSSPGQITATSVTSPVTVTGLTNGTSYTFTVWAANPFGPSPYSASSNSVTPSFTYIEDVFSTWLYTGNGSTQTITTGIDLAGKGGMLWIKSRSQATNHIINDTARGAGNNLMSNSTSAQFTNTDNVSALSSTGFSVGVDSNTNGTAGATYASWTFREQPKFFDVVTYTGNGGTQTISHNLGSVPGCIIYKCTSTSNNWIVYHRSLGEDYFLQLNLTSASTYSTTVFDITAPTSTTFTVGSLSSGANVNGQTYVAYLFAHNAGGFGLTGTDNVISCGSFTAPDAFTNVTVTLGYEPQWVLIKKSSNTGDWFLLDTMRGWSLAASDRPLLPNSSTDEAPYAGAYGNPTATGFVVDPTNTGDGTFIYIAIRRGPMKTPTTGTSVFNTVLSTSATASMSVGFPPDSVFQRSQRTTTTNSFFTGTRLTGNSAYLQTWTTDAEGAFLSWRFDAPTNNFTQSLYSGSGFNAVDYFMRRAPGFFDVVCYTGSSSNLTVNHNLGVVPELMIVKNRVNTGGTIWAVYAGNKDAYLRLNTTNASSTTSPSPWNDTAPTASVFTLSNQWATNLSGEACVAYLFASCPGVSKVGSYTGTGALQTVNCGFTGGARFVLIKRTDDVGDWFVYDSARGITSGNDPYLLMNSTAAEVTGTNYVDTTSVGFQVTAAAPAGLNANGGTFVFLAIS